MTLTEAVEQHRGKSHVEIFTILSAETVESIGSIRGDNLRDVVDILAKGLQDRLDKMVLPDYVEPIRTALVVVFRYMHLPNYGINLSLKENSDLLQSAVQVGLVTQGESDKFFSLATYQKPKYAGLTLKEIIAIAEPELLNVGEWQELIVTNQRRLVVNSQPHVVEHPTMQVQVSESHNGTDWTEWRNAMSFGVPTGVSFHPIVQSDLQRRFRWRGVYYKLNLTVEAV